ncbi:FAD-dependent oxidoreductase [Arthrobacter sp. AK01]|uniref:NAD(P)/FAD-dependent oxidoreductase n=1 Tax=Micrococcaceae TaxID=1268 RepID=UPI001E544A6B|nr:MULTISPECIES: FAD-dependent oxidoreductase [Micrococcaceae]MCD4852680.1 FAD-dependent oxidoreductase [Arthrobacter sp. AK01]MCP1411150.1 3-phenylpropionate/trans-cinnamate dioxygenase ferredoxin reductase subunit [Paenarthrobacter sp. A20]
MHEPHVPEEPIIILGAGHAGVSVAAGLRSQGWEGGVLLVDADDRLPYERPPLSKELLKAGATDQVTPLRRAGYYGERGIETLLGLEVREVDVENCSVTLSNGTSRAYHRLVIATGSTARALRIPGGDLPGVQTLKTFDDATRLRARLAPGAKVVVIGAGYIGLEVAGAAAALGCDVTVLEFQDRVMSRVTSEPVSRFFEQHHEKHGVRFVFGAAVTAVEGGDRVERVVTADGESYPADVVIAGIGVVPNQQLAEAAGLECNDGILVDEHGRTSRPSVYAAGDVTRFTSPFDGSSLRLECIQNAQAQADSIVHHIVEKPRKDADIPWFWTVQHGVRLQTAGVRHPDDDVIVRGNVEDRKFSVVYLRGGRLSAVDTVDSLKDFMAAKKLIAAGAAVDPVLASVPGTPLAEAAI